jgi:predicted negative regulator of RcsB-dependent stress response
MSATIDASASPSRAAGAGRPAAKWLDEPLNRYFLIGGVVVAIALITWFVILSGKRKETFAGRALDQARNIAEQGNLPLAASELQKVVTSYAGTHAAQEAVITLNQVRLVNGQFELAAVGLQDFLKSSPAAQYRTPAYSLLGRALENSKRPGEAAQAYLDAASAAEVEYLKGDLLLDAGRALTLAGERDKAIATYRRIIKDYPTSTSKTEAQVRLAELTGGTM